MTFRPAILYVDDEQSNLNTFKRAFQSDYLVKTCLSAAEALTILEQEEFPLIIADQRMPGMTGIELCEKLIDASPNSIRMILTAYTETQLLLDAINRGHVHDYIVKPWRKSELKPIIEKAFINFKERMAKLQELAVRSDTLEEQIHEIYDFDGLIGATSGLKNVIDTIKKIAPTDSTVLILGETGTGKEILARAVHANSQRRKQTFIPVHCAALATTVLESELFGHEKAAFTGANKTRIGRFEAAQGGTIFLDELGEIPDSVQVKLLRVLQEREIQRVGGNQLIPIDTRIIAATNKNLEKAVKDGAFREDLYYRLNVVPILVPPLRERIGDIPSLAQYFLDKYASQIGRKLILADSAIEQLKRYDWPGNVRELQNIIERAAILSPSTQIDADDLHLNLEQILQTEQIDIANIAKPTKIRAQIEQQQIASLTEILKQNNGNIAAAARQMGIARSTLFHRLKKFGLI